MPYQKGIERREKLVDAAYTLLEERSLETISLADIAQEAKIPTGSAYHFFENAQAVFAALAERFDEALIEAVTQPYTKTKATSWCQVYEAAIDRAVNVYRERPAFCQLILGQNTPPAIKLSDRENDAELGSLFIGILNQHFILPEIQNFDEKMFYSIEIVDLFLSLSYIYHDEITNEMVEEAKKASTAYLERYLPCKLPGREP